MEKLTPVKKARDICDLLENVTLFTHGFRIVEADNNHFVIKGWLKNRVANAGMKEVVETNLKILSINYTNVDLVEDEDTYVRCYINGTF